ncbi:hypothetical protein D0N36_16895 [Hymenobacter lapidiphilus]|uniref:DUF4177 domain-containing protein n=1 Tax=Hymenobacter sp. CCM 8763 TaxID=2303334 RepID=UPI000E342F79|nr:DUF4177 domain-containing protein [Hymenobacter sp. CCM 8763]RFP63885.1 hypothetical protein D0N36_16895 [Hymenobacter sp. CCM 8763]
MKNQILLLSLLLSMGFGTPLTASAQTSGAGYMMIISRVSLGFDAQASIVAVAADGKERMQEVDFSRFSAKQMAANMTEVHKVALATVNTYAADGWHIVSIVPSEISSGGSTVFSQTIYYLARN